MSDHTVNQPPVATQTQSSLMKDLMIPLSIVIAGAFIGAGLYFSGGVSAAKDTADSVAPVAADDKTSLVKPVTSDDHIRGEVDAEIMIIEFSDFDCPYCNRYHDTMKQLSEKYAGDEVAWVYRHFPLEQLHPQAAGVAIASECVAELGGNDAFWTFADAYLAARGAGDATAHGELIPRVVTEAGIDLTDFSKCFESGRHTESVQADINNAVETGGRGTPWSILVGPTGKTYPINGSLPIATIENLIELAKQEAS
jgi:protein-disulfide isomerase